MRFKKGSKVEVLSREVPSGAWHTAEIICGNGHNYSVRYLSCFLNDAIVERVPRKAIRPCPPPLSPKNFVPGDIIEVYDNFSWKIATVSKVSRGGNCLVRLLGSDQEMKVQKFDVRLRQFWKDDKWFVIEQGSKNHKQHRSDENIVLKYNQKSKTHLGVGRIKFQVKDKSLPYNNVPESQVISSKTLKRGSPYGCSYFEEYVGPGQKFRLVEKDGRSFKAAAATKLSPIPQQVDDASFPQEMPGENCTLATNNRKSGFSAMDTERRTMPGGVRFSVALNLRYKDNVSVISSVGSCTTTSNNSYKLPCHFTVPTQDHDDQVSDAESVCPLEHDEGDYFLPAKEELEAEDHLHQNEEELEAEGGHFLPKEEKLEAEVHKLELHAYCCTLEAFYASGPWSWEREALVTNLRLMLNISNDEHLMVLRNLLS